MKESSLHKVSVVADLKRFEDKVRETAVLPVVADQIVDVVRHLIEWSERQAELEFDPSTERDQATVKYRLTSQDVLLWSAYPRKSDGAKIELIAGGGHWPGMAIREWLAEQLVSFGAPLQRKPGETLMVPAVALINGEGLAAFTNILETLAGLD